MRAVLLIAGAYLCGSLPIGVRLGAVWGFDVRTAGSGNRKTRSSVTMLMVGVSRRPPGGRQNDGNLLSSEPSLRDTVCSKDFMNIVLDDS
jgi:hypothetical protein